MIIRTEKNRNNPYYMKNRAATEDPRLSWKAKGVHDYLMSKPDNWEANINQLVKASPDGAAAVRSAVKELIKYGYIARVQVRESGKIAGWRLDTFESPALNPFHKDGKTSLAIDDGSDDELDSEIRDLDDEQDGGFQHVENLDVENRTHNKYSSVVSNENKNNHAPPEPKPPAPVTPTPVSSSFSYDCSEMFRFHDTNFGTLTQYSRDMLLDYVETYGGPDIVIDAMRVAVQANKKSLRYTEGVLKNWHADGRDDKKTKAPSPTKSNSTAGSYVPVDVMAELERITLEQQRIGSH